MSTFLSKSTLELVVDPKSLIVSFTLNIGLKVLIFGQLLSKS